MVVRYGSLPFEEAIDFFKNKLNIPTERWNDVWRDGHNSGFMVAGALKDDLLNDFRKAVDSAIAEGKSIGWFQKEFKNITAKHGWSYNGEADWRSKVIYNTNMRQSYNAGRYEQLQHFPIWRYLHGDSRQPRALHLKWHGLTLPQNDAWWPKHYPSNGFGCNCRVEGLSQQTVDRKGIKIDSAPDDGLWDWTDKVTGEVHEIPKGIDPSFDYTPKKSAILERQKAQAKQKAKVFVPPPRIAPSAFSTVNGANVHTLNTALEGFSEAKPRIKQLGLFLDKHNIKTVFIKQAEMSAKNKASKALIPQIEPYLNKSRSTHAYYTTRKANRTNGLTSFSFDHVVVKVKASTKFSKARFEDLAKAVENAILLMREGDKQWSLSHIVRVASESGDHGGALVTWLHELGHQVHYKAGQPSMPIPVGHGITEYSLTNSKEWHAEHFAMWLLNREALANWEEGIAVYFDELMKEVI
jgi:hypothetical protein